MNRRKPQEIPHPPAWRSRLVLGLFAALVVVFELRLAWLQFVRGDYYTLTGELVQIREVPIPAHRGLITDRNGEPIAISTPADSIYVNPREFPVDREQVFALARATGRDGEELEREISSRRDREFHWIRRRMPPADAEAVMALGFDGVGRRREYRRYSPHAEVTCHLLGLTNTDDEGIEGLELLYNEELRGRPGLKEVQRDLKGRPIADIREIEPARPGRDLRASIDMDLQFWAYLELKKAVQANAAESGSFVLLDVLTGEVLALAVQPSCNPNDDAQRQDLSLFRNTAITDPIEPGSTIKPLVLAAALANGFTPETTINVGKHLEINGRILTSDDNVLGPASLTRILARSSSVGMGLVADSLEAESIWRALSGFRIGLATDSGLGVIESPGMLPRHENWSRQTKAVISYGYNLSVTPLQLARAYAAIANAGRLPPVSLRALDATPSYEQVISPEIAADLLAMMVEAVASDEGTAKRAAIPNYLTAGKTGTVKIHETGGGYSDSRYRAIFVGIAPASDPRFVAVIVINNPRGTDYYGGQVAAPVFAPVVSRALRMYGIAPDAPAAQQLALRAEVGQ